MEWSRDYYTYELGGRVRKVEAIDRCPKTLIGVGFLDFGFEFIALRENEFE
jgi:hypothetical protein